MASPATPVAEHNRRPSVQKVSSGSGTAKNRSPTRDSTPTAAARGIQRSVSVKGSPNTAKIIPKKIGTSSVKAIAGDDAKAETAALIEDLKAQLRKAEEVSEEYQKKLYVAQTQLDEARNEQARMEVVAQSYSEKLDGLGKTHQEILRNHRDLQGKHEEEKFASEREKEQAHAREMELQTTVHKLKESMSLRDRRKSVDSETLLTGTPPFRGRSSPRPPPDSPLARRDSSQSSQSNLVLQKDKVIESLRLELAEAQIKIAEQANAGGGRMHELEKQLLEARMSNAKLLEDNESYQVLLSEKTLNGDFAKSDLLGVNTPNYGRLSLSRQTSREQQSSGNLADELSLVDGDNIPDSEGDRKVRRLENELAATKDQNKALTLYINKIISRLLANEQFEKLFVEGDSHVIDDDKPSSSGGQKNKDLPATPADAQATAGSSFLQRAGSLFGGRRARPSSMLPPSSFDKPLPSEPTASGQLEPSMGITNRRSLNPYEDPATAPSLPIRRTNSTRGGTVGPRTHRRANSEWSATMGNATYRGSPTSLTGPSYGPPSPSAMHSPPRQTFMVSPSQTPLILEDNTERLEAEQDRASAAAAAESASAADMAYDGSATVYSSRAPSEIVEPSSPRSLASAALEGRSTNTSALTVPSSASSASGDRAPGPAARVSGWFSGGAASAKPNQMRPLRLVQEKQEADEEKKRANRASFMSGWFGQAGPAGAPQWGRSSSDPPGMGPVEERGNDH